MNALEMLQADHQRISDLFEQLQQASDIDQKRDIFELIRDALHNHLDIEETHFYPLFKGRDSLIDLIEESFDDHAEIRDLVEEIDSLDDETEIEDRFDELQEIVNDHVALEENSIFPKVAELQSTSDLEDLGERMRASKTGEKRAA